MRLFTWDADHHFRTSPRRHTGLGCPLQGGSVRLSYIDQAFQNLEAFEQKGCGHYITWGSHCWTRNGRLTSKAGAASIDLHTGSVQQHLDQVTC